MPSGQQQFNQPQTTLVGFDTSATTCYNCKVLGHLACQCPSPKIQRPMSNLATTSTSSQPWIVDIRATHHLTSDLGNLALHLEYQGPETVQLGNGTKLSISSIGSFTSSLGNENLLF